MRASVWTFLESWTKRVYKSAWRINKRRKRCGGKVRKKWVLFTEMSGSILVQPWILKSVSGWVLNLCRTWSQNSKFFLLLYHEEERISCNTFLLLCVCVKCVLRQFFSSSMHVRVWCFILEDRLHQPVKHHRASELRAKWWQRVRNKKQQIFQRKWCRGFFAPCSLCHEHVTAHCSSWDQLVDSKDKIWLWIPSKSWTWCCSMYILKNNCSSRFQDCSKFGHVCSSLRMYPYPKVWIYLELVHLYKNVWYFPDLIPLCRVTRSRSDGFRFLIALGFHGLWNESLEGSFASYFSLSLRNFYFIDSPSEPLQ